MIKNLIISGAAFAVTSAVAFGATAVFDFESVPATATPFGGALTSLIQTDGGLNMTLSRVGITSFDVVNNSLQPSKPAGWGGKSLAPFVDNSAPSYFVGDFSQPIVSLSAEFGDYGPSDDDTPVTITAWDGPNGTGNLIDQVTGPWTDSDSFPDFGVLNVSGAGILSITFTSGGNFPNSIFWDNFRVEFDGPSVPDSSSTVGVLGLGLAFLIGVARRR